MRVGIILLTAFLMYVPVAKASQPKNTSFDTVAANNVSTQSVTSSPQNRSPLEVHALIEENNTRPWWFGDLVTLLGILVGAGMIIYQLGRQHKNELALQRENAREQLRLQIFQEFSPVIKVATEKIIDAETYVSSIHSNLRMSQQLLEDALPIKERATEFSKRHQEATYSLIKLIGLIGKYEVVSPQLDIFKLAIGVAKHDMTIAGGRLIRILPMDIMTPDGVSQVVNVIRSTEQLNELDKLLGDYKRAEMDIIGYLNDLNIEMQNIFLSKLFDNKVPRRQPLDPRIKVVSTEPEEMEKLRKYYEEETDWGKSGTASVSRVRPTHH